MLHTHRVDKVGSGFFWGGGVPYPGTVHSLTCVSNLYISRNVHPVQYMYTVYIHVNYIYGSPNVRYKIIYLKL